jgi:GT2 family glycosyltransferase
LYVWDNDSTDGSADYVARHFPGAHLVRSAENVGFAKANNMGFQYALDHGYDYVYLLNQDAWLAPGALETLVAAAQAHPDYAVLSPLQYQDGYQAFDSQFAKLYHGSEEGVGFQTASEPDEVVEVKRIMAAHWLVPVGALKTVGPFEEELFPLYGQDDDWCNRARYHKLKVGIVPDAKAVHDRALRQEPKEKVIRRNYYTGSLIRLCDPNRPLWERFLFVCLFTLVKSVKYGSLLPFKYFRQICGQLPAVRRHRDFSIRC